MFAGLHHKLKLCFVIDQRVFQLQVLTGQLGNGTHQLRLRVVALAARGIASPLFLDLQADLRILDLVSSEVLSLLELQSDSFLCEGFLVFLNEIEYVHLDPLQGLLSCPSSLERLYDVVEVETEIRDSDHAFEALLLSLLRLLEPKNMGSVESVLFPYDLRDDLRVVGPERGLKERQEDVYSSH